MVNGWWLGVPLVIIHELDWDFPMEINLHPKANIGEMGSTHTFYSKSERVCFQTNPDDPRMNVTCPTFPWIWRTFQYVPVFRMGCVFFFCGHLKYKPKLPCRLKKLFGCGTLRAVHWSVMGGWGPPSKLLLWHPTWVILDMTFLS